MKPSYFHMLNMIHNVIIMSFNTYTYSLFIVPLYSCLFMFYTSYIGISKPIWCRVI